MVCLCGEQQIAGFSKSQAAKAVHQAKLPEEVIRFNKTHRAYTEEMRLPGYKDAVIPDEKITGYALNKSHPVGRNKAVVFEKVLGYNSSNQEQLVKQVKEGLVNYQAKSRQETKYGKPFGVDMMVKGTNGRYAKVLTDWMIDKGSKTPRLTSIRVAKKKGDSDES